MPQFTPDFFEVKLVLIFYVFQFCNQIVWLAQVACFARGNQVPYLLSTDCNFKADDNFLANLACKTFISACCDRVANSNIVLYRINYETKSYAVRMVMSDRKSLL